MKTISVILDEETYKKLKEIADKQERTLSYIVRKALAIRLQEAKTNISNIESSLE